MDIDLQLPSHQRRLERLYNSKAFTGLERTLSQSNARFANLAPHQRLLAVYLLQHAGDNAFEDMWTLFYKRRPPTIEEYLTRHLPETALILYPKWEQTITRLYQPGAQYYEWILGGSIGAGKTTAAIIAHCYNLVRVALLLNPHGTLGAAPNKGLILSLFTITLPKARKALVEPFKALMLESTDLFEEVDDRKYWKAGFPGHGSSDKIPFYDNSTELAMPNNIAVMLGSQTSHALSFDMFGAFLDEAEFRDQGGDVDKAFEIYSNLKERVDSRFLDSRFKLVTLVSSARYSTGIIAQYTASIPKDSKTTIYSAYPIWEIKQFDAYGDGSFHVLRGNDNHPSRILSPEDEALAAAGEYQTPPGCELLRVPLVYLDKFQFRIEDAIRNLAGMQTLGADQPFPDPHLILDGNLPAEFTLVAELPSSLDQVRIPLINKVPTYVFQQTPEGRRLFRYPTLARYAHVDLATVNVAAITIMHKELQVDRTVYVTDMTLQIMSPKRIDLNAITEFLVDLARTVNVYFETISFDQFQSDAPRQTLELAGIAKSVVLLSVDRTLGPYGEASRMVTAGQVRTGACPNLQAQMLQVQLFPNRSSEKVKRGPAGKDQLDSWVGALTNAINNVADVPYAKYVDREAGAYQAAAEEGIFRRFRTDDGLQEI
jgi:hypothetical protein